MYFVLDHVPAEVWIQSRKEESNSTWRLHDCSILPEICPRTTSNLTLPMICPRTPSNTPNELHLRYIPGSGCLDHYPKLTLLSNMSVKSVFTETY